MTTVSPGPGTDTREQCLTLGRVTWRQYDSILETLDERAGLRVTFVDGRLTLSSPTRRHDRFESGVGRLAEEVADALGLLWECAGHATCRREEIEAGVEGDNTYYFNVNADLMRGSTNIDLSSQLPPDLVIEVELTNSADDSVKIWGRLGVPEGWRLDVRRWSLVFLERRPAGEYEPIGESRALAPLRPAEALERLAIVENMTISQWRRELPDWAREVVRPGRVD